MCQCNNNPYNVARLHYGICSKIQKICKKSFDELDFDAAKRDVAPFLANT